MYTLILLMEILAPLAIDAAKFEVRLVSATYVMVCNEVKKENGLKFISYDLVMH